MPSRTACDQPICKARAWCIHRGFSSASEQPLPAESPIDFLTAPADARVYKANGVDPA